jgi:hypothetical protein
MTASFDHAELMSVSLQELKDNEDFWTPSSGLISEVQLPFKRRYVQVGISNDLYLWNPNPILQPNSNVNGHM